MTTTLKQLGPEIDALLPKLAAIYKDLHQHPELSMQEFRTASIAADHLKTLGYEVSEGLGTTGVVGILKNGSGPVVMLRADMDALPMAEKTGLPYASQAIGEMPDGSKTPVSHMCGHDLHVAWLMGAAELLADHRSLWHGTLMVVFQPGEEIGQGALAMIADMKDDFPKPDIILGQHVMVGKAGTVGYRAGAILSAGDSVHIKFHGKGAHGSMPQNAIDPVMIAAYSAVRLQTIVSRETAPLDSAVLTIGSIQAGTKENIIPDDAILKLNMRSYKDTVRDKMIRSVKRICCCESHASGAGDPEIEFIDSYPVTVNDQQATERLSEQFIAHFGERCFETQPATASEDFSQFGRHWQVPYVFWFIGGTDPQVWLKAEKAGAIETIPANHSSQFTLHLEETIQAGLEAMVVAALTWSAVR
ncbi:amidohydrolase [Rosenbergiella australiborealis]|uniref:Amidohydrolase n=1 Tax=Rosenbergiella australiborealis TaxID=1544696 RepID=A0ABS5T4V0_9GAMM|nr:amidohydrolase [Rosenbergiella australiborealis]MBT0727152.1 amidohydrolase [Rosenbergiella australiborealis]